MTTDLNILFQNYFSKEKNYDEALKSDLTVNPNWKKLLDNVSEMDIKTLTAKQNEIDWLMDENGVTYNVYNDPQGMQRSWDLNIIPFIIKANEWHTIEKGLQQRAELLNLIIKDIYGKRDLIKKGIIPPEVIFAHRGFLRQCDQIQYKTSKHLLIYSSDLARGPDGRMWVVNDRTQAPSGMGYALENRYSLNRVLPNLFKDINVKQSSGFFYDFNQMLIDAAPQNKENPSIVILTPGPLNETYFEHAYMASLLGYPLVNGNDLVVRNGKVYLKTLKELKQVDVIYRRVDDVFMDPLELREDSYLGVTGLLDVVRNKNISIINPVGSGVLENSGLIPFMNAICNHFFNEDLILPQIASWWCGQEKEREFVFKNIKNFVVKRIDRSNRESLFFCEFLDNNALETLKKDISANPYRYVAQEKITFSTAPDFVKDHLEARKVLCRTFVIAKKDQYQVMPGGLVRVAPERENLFVSNQRGGVSKDLWVLSNDQEDNIKHYAWDNTCKISISDINDLPSNTAENLFWSGRYLGRTLVTARYIRMILNRMSDEQYDSNTSSSESLVYLLHALTNITSTFPGFTGKNNEALLNNPLKEIISLLFDKNRLGSFAQALNSFNNSYYSLRNLWSKDMWRVFDSIKKLWTKFEQANVYTIPTVTKLLDRTITRLIAFMGLIEESILVQQGLLLYFIGLQTEQALMQISKFRSLMVFNYDERLQYDILEALLSSDESLNIYRYSYRSHLSLENVINLTLLDKEYPKSLTYRLKRIQKDIDRLPYTENIGNQSNCQKLIDLANAKISKLNIAELMILNSDESLRERLDAELTELSDLLHETSLSLSGTYFNHSYQQTQLINQNFPLS
ncbi:circularly permuted type 2 ATP-grasp protein [Aestuariibaculum sediminum]|uniref:Circularly permuted type 2 ATP-grasp protein n=1 Tax=Aestuariibaculum sediminum TaxID=2770637 RepID=A0A8J6Q2I4_9FLAO|nr:circularly permuted type 2 ATP-grasp protein [Aestuariibaculum sediminum]MBD0832166.1 circularly permuted type 2 ATP-grasp protein [Aestuariibaculum sediminum]